MHEPAIAVHNEVASPTLIAKDPIVDKILLIHLHDALNPPTNEVFVLVFEAAQLI